MTAFNFNVNIELNSFISKLVQLNSNGVSANLNINAFGGILSVSLNADFGHNFGGGYTFNKKPPKPARLRRRLRRKEKLGRTNCDNIDGSNLADTTDETTATDGIENAATITLSSDVPSDQTSQPAGNVIDNDDDLVLPSPFKKQNIAEDAHHISQQDESNFCNEFFTTNRFSSA